jgi:hypothetical protein
MAAKQSKRALAEAAALLATDTQAARAYLRGVQRLAGPLPYATIVAAMRAVGHADASAVAASASALHADGPAGAQELRPPQQPSSRYSPEPSEQPADSVDG